MSRPATQVLGDYVATENVYRRPADVREKVQLCLVDSIGCLLGAFSHPVSKIMEDFAACLSGGRSSVKQSIWDLDSPNAAFVLATMINALDFDDIYVRGHPGATVVSAALAAAKNLGSSGGDLLEAMVVGYDVSGRIGLSLLHKRLRKAAPTL